MSEDSRRSQLVRVAAARVLPPCIALLFGWWMLARREYLLIDDAYISFRYATDLGHGNGLVWNVGVPVEGYTCLLWVVLLSSVAKLGVDLTWPAVLLSAGFGVACLELLRRIAARTSNDLSSEQLPSLLLACLPTFAHALTSGMEETCFAFLALLGIHLLVLGRERPALRWFAGLSFAGATLTRPEGPLIAVTACAVEMTGWAGARTRVRALVGPLAAVGIVAVAHTLVRLAYYGYPLPNTFYAKVIFGRATIERGAAHLSSFLLAGGWIMLLGLPGLRSLQSRLPWVVHGYALAASYGSYLLFVGGDHPHWFRFYIPLVQLPLLSAGKNVWAWTNALAQRMRRAGPRWSASGAVVFCMLAGVLTVPFSEAYEPVVGYIDPPLKKLVDDIDRFFSEVPQDSFCAVAAIGYVGYRHMGLHILDTWGLTDTHIAHVDAAPTVKFGHDKQDLGYVASMKPDYVYVFAAPPAGPLLFYDLCWPSDDPPAAVYRRSVALTAAERNLGLPPGRTRRLEPPPECRRPSYAVPPPADSAESSGRP